jgi:IS5 family transposase
MESPLRSQLHDPLAQQAWGRKPGKQYDGHSLESSLKKAEDLSQTAIEQAFVDKGYKGHGIEGRQIYISGQKRGMTRTLKKHLKRRSAIEPHIGHMKSEGKLRRNYLKGTIGDAFNALLCAIRHNMRLIWRHIRSLFVLIWIYLFGNLETKNDMRGVIIVP